VRKFGSTQSEAERYIPVCAGGDSLLEWAMAPGGMALAGPFLAGVCETAVVALLLEQVEGHGGHGGYAGFDGGGVDGGEESGVGAGERRSVFATLG
jgi:hypothetical protein